MSLTDPTIQDTATIRRSGAGMVIWCAVIFALALIGGWAMASMTGVDSGFEGFRRPPTTMDHIVHIGGLGVGIIGLLFVILGFVGAAQTPGLGALGLASEAWGIAAGGYLAYRHLEELPHSGTLRTFLIIGALCLLWALRARLRQGRLARLARSGTPHVAVVHKQGYTEATWEDASGTDATVVLKFVDAQGRDRFVSRRILQFKANPLSEGTQVTMFYDPTQPENLAKIVFVRDLGRRPVYF